MTFLLAGRPEGDVFVGRKAELARLADALARVRQGEPWLVTIEGESGVGKTALARRSLTSSAGLIALWARADPGEADLEYGPGRLGPGRAGGRRAGPAARPKQPGQLPGPGLGLAGRMAGRAAGPPRPGPPDLPARRGHREHRKPGLHGAAAAGPRSAAAAHG